ncbi:unnamed protein product [Agarophyton chilense]|eukprot:gb/GEZJ01002268.1/.p1 GENE.gb/GEZJ01002268.1/~~gb/GEZJ01002268.1/.p1  ORF type:complete len:246 (-),score=34.75 gb/GEZJ01002268.1/:3955-4692(-)
MGGASRGRVAKKQRSSKQHPELVPHSSSRSMRRGFTRVSRLQPAPKPAVDYAAIERMFHACCDLDADKIGPEGIQALFERLDIDILDISTLIFAWKLQARVPFEFSKKEFVDGCANLRADSWDKLKKVIPSLKASITQPKDFRSFYMYAFEYNKPPEQRSLPIETARQLFPLIFAGRFKHLSLWMDFLNNRRQAISRDTYTLLLDFVNTIDESMSNYDEENGAWPVLLDEFVDFAKPQLNKNSVH